MYRKINMKKILNNITIFDYFPVFNCFDASLYSLVLNLGGDPKQIILNEYNCLNIDKDNNFLFSRLLDTSYENLMEKMGFEYEEIFTKNEKIIDVIIDGIDSDNVYMIHLYEPISYDVDFEKRNYNYERLHWLIIYGYDANNKRFYTMDYLDVNTFIFKPMIMTYQDLIMSYDKTYSQDQPYLIRVKKINYPQLNSYGDINEFINIFFKNIMSLKNFFHEFKNYINTKDRDKYKLIAYIKNIILFSNYLKKIQYVFNDNSFNRDFYLLINKLSKNIRIIIDNSVKVFQFENKYLNNILSMLNDIDIIIEELLKTNYVQVEK